jgi:adenosine deaminase
MTTAPAAAPADTPAQPPINTAAAALARAHLLPKVLLHEHLDGGLRVDTLLALLLQRGLQPPADTASGLAAWFQANAHAGSLEKYLEGFALTVAAMASPEAMERVAFEAAEDALDDGVVLAEFRIAPLLFEAHGVPGEAVIEALLAGLKRSKLPSGLIVCGMRHEAPEETQRAARLALKYQGQGVVAFDLAGAEFGHPPSRHAGALRVVREAGLAITLHAAEADGAERVLEAAELGATRIGHGVHLVEALRDPAREWMVEAVRQRGLHLEVCPTSNVHTGAARSLATHPITDLWHAGVSLSYHTDNRLMSCVGMSQEAAALMAHTDLSEVDLLAMATEAARHSFLPQAERDVALETIAVFSAGLLPRAPVVLA